MYQMTSKYDSTGFRIDFSISCNDIVSKYDWVMEYGVHVRNIVAVHPSNLYSKPISQHETGKSLRDARIWPLSTNCYCQMQRYGLKVQTAIAECSYTSSKYGCVLPNAAIHPLSTSY